LRIYIICRSLNGICHGCMSSPSTLFLCSFLSYLFPCSSLLSLTLFSNWYMAGKKKKIRSQKLLPHNAITMLFPLTMSFQTRSSLPFFVVYLHAIFIVPVLCSQNLSTHLLHLRLFSFPSSFLNDYSPHHRYNCHHHPFWETRFGSTR
jgi:hypothetical protein